MKTGIALLAMAVSVGLLSAGCSTAAEPVPSEQEEVMIMAADVPLRQAPEVADPEGAVNAIYGELKDYIARDIDSDTLKDIIGVMDLNVSKVLARYSDPKGGLADVIIAKPKPGYTVEVREALYRYIDRRVAEFEGYDVLNSLEIAQNAVIFEQGEYIIMLMLADNEAAQVLIDQYIPI